MTKRLTLLALLFMIPTLALAQHAASERPREEADGTHPTQTTPHAPTQVSYPSDSYPRPDLSPYYPTWAGAMIIIIGGMFLAAAVIGPVVRADMPEQLPLTHSHDEPPGASRPSRP